MVDDSMAGGPPARRYVLIDGEERHRAHPLTFRLPPRTVRETVERGAIVKIGVEAGGRGERFWVQVERVDPGPSYTGSIDNTLRQTDLHGLSCRDIVTFGPEHVLDVYL